MRTLLTLTTAALILAACGEATPAAAQRTVTAESHLPLDASGAPRMKPGLYEVIEVDGDEEPRTVHECVGEEANAEIRKLLAQQSTPDCKVSRSSTAGGLEVTSECLQNGMTNKLKLTMTGTDRAYRATLDVAVTTKDGKTTTARSTAEGRWTGACPAGLMPGETLEDQEDQEDQ